MNKINIAIVDSNLMQRSETFEIVEKHLSRTPFKVNIREFDSGPELIREVGERGRYDIYIMEVMMPDMNGILLAKELRSVGDHGIIIYLSQNEKDAYQAFQVKASDYILKSLLREKLAAALDDNLQKIIKEETPPVVEIKSKSGVMRVPVNSITYVDTVDRALCFHMESGRCLKTNCLRGSFKEALERAMDTTELMQGFAVAGVSCLLNLSHIMELSNGAVLLKNGEMVYIPKSAQKSLNNAWEKYML